MDASLWPTLENRDPADNAEIEAVKSFGNDDLKAVTDHFKFPLEGSGCNIANALMQYRKLKLQRAISVALHQKSSHGFWQYIFKERSDNCKDILIEFTLTLYL